MAPRNLLRKRFRMFLPLLMLAGFGYAQDSEIPRVLVLGDNLHRGFVQGAARELKGKVDFVFPKEKLADTGSFLANLEKYELTESSFDLIYFNFGLADLQYRDPNSRQLRVLSKKAGGVRTTGLEVYEKNLEAIVSHLQKTGARLVWSSTTPIEGNKYGSIYDEGSEVEYNASAARVMEKLGVAVNDMHGWIMVDKENRLGADPFSYNRIPTHEPIVATVSKLLFKEEGIKK